MDLLSETYRLLGRVRGEMTLREIAQGAGVNYHWLGKFAQRAYSDPSVVKVQALHTFLASHSDRERPAA